MTEAASPAERVLARHSKSFAFAARFLAPKDRRSAADLYAFCRLVDDLADDAASADEGKVALALVQDELRELSPARPEVADLLRLHAEQNVSIEAAHELIAGVRSDLETKVRIATIPALIKYAYQVAGTVGLMMCGVLGVRSEKAAPFAIDLGIAMQLTNIARDVLEDADLDRVYVPLNLLEIDGAHPEVLSQLLAAPLTSAVEHVLELADQYYQSAASGLHYVPLRPRFAILVASRVYRRIGRKLLASGANPLEGRTVVSKPAKLLEAVWSLTWLVRPSFYGLLARPHRRELHEALRGLPGASA